MISTIPPGKTASALPAGAAAGGGAAAAAPAATNIYRGSFELADTKDTTVSLLLRDLGEQQWIYFNGQPVAQNVARDPAGHQFDFDPAALRSGKNVIAIIATPLAGGRGAEAARRGRDAAARRWSRRSPRRATGNEVSSTAWRK